ncbi:MAG: conjugative transfer signal peptidase TraF [Pseudomonadota bacterium]|nr:conjugative transfer signal peptidase TraF [Pseudomonadota bacterium]
MHHITRKHILMACLPGAVLLIAGVIAGLAGVRFNITKSLPLGLWHITDQIGRGTYVTACVPPTAPMMQVAIERRYLPDGACKGGYAPLLKRVVAVQGDIVTLTPDAVLVNGVALPNTATLAYRAIDPLPAVERGTYALGPGEFWLIANDDARSFDSRYFGALHRSDIAHGMKPLLVF